MANTEHLLHYIWKNRLYNPESLKTAKGTLIEVLDPGLHNEDAGPDFFNAKIKLNNTVWAGNVEIHLTSNDWYSHGHNHDKAYNSVILHVSEEVNRVVVNEMGQELPQCEMKVPERLRNSSDFLLFSKCRIPCKNFLTSLSSVKLNAWLTVLAFERLERKTNDINRHLKRFNNSWDDVFYVMLTRNFGFGINSDEFERLALSLPYNIVQKHGDSLFQVEALMFGQAGLLNNVSCQDEFDDYYYKLQNEYSFLKVKYRLKSPDDNQMRRLRVRPGSFPEMRIAQLAALLQKSGRLFSTFLEKEDYDQMTSHFKTEPSVYWQTHYSFSKKSGRNNKILGKSSLDILIINTVAPILFAYGKKTLQEEYCIRAQYLLESIKPENNSITREFSGAGVIPKNAMESQALIQLKKEYCDKRKCLYCRIGHKLLSSKQ
ncbi:MAG: DUF2851 family protein [Fermentimonas sp.]|nr:DUF2851 family protein [Fermentimonas sp.]